MSNYFPCNIGVRQGENLSPLLFSIFLNDLHQYFLQIDLTDCVEIPNPNHVNMMHAYLKIFILLYADDTVVISETASSLQRELNIYAQYCDKWKLTVNISKSKVVVFSKGRRPLYNFQFKSMSIYVTNEYKYLRIYFSRSGSFQTAKKRNCKSSN